MKYYKEVIIPEPDAVKREILIAELSMLGYEGFEEDSKQVKAYIDNVDFNGVLLDALAGEKQVEYRVNTLQEKNWNAEWESSFSPVVVDDLAVVRAHFHEPIPGPRYDILVTPKMSFGTGHHATTWLMMKALQEAALQEPKALAGRPLAERRVLDFGTGTGILAILAGKMGAGEILAIDNDPWSVENALENVANNQGRHITVKLASEIPAGETFDIVLANINKHVLLAIVNDIYNSLVPNGILILSGVLAVDLPDMEAAYQPLFSAPESVLEKNNWLAITFVKRP